MQLETLLIKRINFVYSLKKKNHIEVLKGKKYICIRLNTLRKLEKQTLSLKFHCFMV